MNVFGNPNATFVEVGFLMMSRLGPGFIHVYKSPRKAMEGNQIIVHVCAG